MTDSGQDNKVQSFLAKYGSSPRLAALGLSLREETEDDVPFVCNLYRDMRWEELAQAPGWSEEDKTAFLVQQFNAQRFHYSRAYYDGEYLLLERNGEPIGRLYLFRTNPRDIRIIDIGILSTFRNRGLGRAVLETVFDDARDTGRTVSIHVEIFNPARRLYDRLGFVEIGEHGPYRLMEWRG